MASDAVGSERVSRIVGYKITKGDFSNSSPNLPQRIAILAEANEANQSTLDTTPREVLSAQEAGQLYGYGSPIYHIMRILRPITGGGVQGIPTIVYPQAKAVGSTQKILEITPTGTATGNGTHNVVLAGRYGIDSQSYAISVEEGDTASIICGKIEDAINNVVGAPVIAVNFDYEVDLTSKWSGLTADALSVTVDTNDNDLGITYTVVSRQSATGTPDVSAALTSFGTNWNTIVINSYGTVTSVMDDLETYNGIPDPTTPTGRFVGTIMKPFIALTGTVADDPSSITDSRLNDVTIALCPAPASSGLQFEAAANMAVLFARTTQDNPHLDVSGQSYPDMPVPETSIGSMASYDSRDSFVKKGCSTVDLVSGRYQVQDFVTTYHKIGEIPPQFRYCRNLMIDFNVRFGYYLLEIINVVDHAIAADSDVVSVSNVVKPKQWKQVLVKYADDLASRALINDAPFMQENIVVNLSSTNPDRLETTFKYKRSSYARIAATTAEAGFNFGN